MECKLCQGRGMVEMPHGSYENGFWENCPMCHPEPELPKKTWSMWVTDVLFWLTLPLWPSFYLLSRLQAKPCPHCGEKWYTELCGEWGDEDWKCRSCGKYWSVPYNK